VVGILSDILYNIDASKTSFKSNEKPGTTLLCARSPTVSMRPGSYFPFCKGILGFCD
jgi:hypothetical protein